MEPALAEVFAFVVDKLVAAGLASRRCLAVDGTKIPGNVAQFQAAVSEAAQRSDPEARRMGMKGRTIGYNAQAAVDKDSGYVMGAAVLGDASDYAAMAPVLEAVGEPPEEVVADGGFVYPFTGHSTLPLSTSARVTTLSGSPKRSRTTDSCFPSHPASFYFSPPSTSQYCAYRYPSTATTASHARIARASLQGLVPRASLAM